jgi:signal transduction histidine kinase/DNA-binding response OmpR family regulator/streptogramin lyase
VGTDSGIVSLDRARNVYSASYLPQNSRVTNISIDPQNIMCLGTDGAGVWQFHPGEGPATPLLSSTGAPLVNSNAVYALYEDGDGRKWIGTLRGGINVIEPRTSSFKTVTYDPPGQKNIVNNFILSFCEDAGHNLWIGTDGAGLRYWNRRTNTFRTYVHNPSDPGSINNDFITSILRDDQDHLWVATWFDGVNRLDRATGKFDHLPCMNPETKMEEKHVWALVEDHNKQIWASATNEGGLYRFEKDRFVLFDEQVSNLQVLSEDREGNLWGGNYSSLIRIDRVQKRHTYYPIGYTVRCLHEDRAGRFWVGTQEGGLLLFDRHTGTYKRYTTADGLPSNTILRILEDAHGNLWMSTYNGLSEYQQGRFRNFSPSDGLQSTQFSFNAGLALSSGELVFGGIKGFNIFSPDSVLQVKRMPNVYLMQVRIENEPIQADARFVTARSEGEIRELTVPFNKAMLSLDFTALEYGSTDKINYAYCLAGWDKGWNYSNGSRTANYSGVREGSYIFKVRVSHADGTWSNVRTLLRVVVLPPWYRTWWAYLGYGLLLAGLALLYVWYTRGRIRLKYEVRLAQLETEKEKELIERKLSFFTHITHEFRNPLTLIINPVKELLETSTREDDQERLPFVYRNAQRLLGLVDQLLLFRKAESGSDELKAAPVDAVSLCREVYLCFVEGARAGKVGYRFEAEVDELLLYLDKEKVEIALYNLLSNALKYTPEGGEVVLSIAEETDSVSVMVTDTGMGIPPEVGDQVFDKFYQIRRRDMTSISGFGIGLYLVKQFVVAHGGEITYQSEVGKGTRFVLHFLKGTAHLKGVVTGGEQTGLSPLVKEMAEAPGRGAEKRMDVGLVSGAKSLLIVDDDAQILSYVEQVFDRHFIVYKALNGEDGLRLAREHRPDLIISDVHMEGISGIELCETIKNDRVLAQTPVVLLTASASANNKLEGVKHGADDYITKPFDRDLLIARVSALLASRDRVEQSIYHTITQGGNAPRISAEDKEFLDRIVATVEAHLEEEDFSIKKLSLTMGMSHSLLYQKLKELSGQSLNGFIRFIRLRKAAELFIDTHYNVNEVALQVGIGDGKYFREQFHKQYGVNPSEFIKKYRKPFSNKYHLKRAP